MGVRGFNLTMPDKNKMAELCDELSPAAKIGGAFIPMLTLGIPGDAVTAVLISALTTQGLRPGPNLISQTPDLFWLIVASLLLASVFLLVFGLTGYFLKLYNYPIAPIVLGCILTKLCEENYRRGVMLEGSVHGMLGSIFTSPISIVLFALLVFLFATQTETYKNWKAKREAKNAAA